MKIQTRYNGLLLIGDPHLEGRVPGFRKDDYPRVALNKLRWCLNYAASENLLPAVLGDLFHLPRDNPNWMLVELMQLFSGDVILGIYGNHDVHGNNIDEHDSLSVIAEAGRIKLLDGKNVFRCFMGGRPAIIGGTPWGKPLPERYAPDSESSETPFVVWLVHHDMSSGGNERGKVRPHEIPGIDLVVNGHIHKRMPSIITGETEWVTPGNICRRTRSDADRFHRPSVLRVDFGNGNWRSEYVEVPHRPFEEVFHEAVADEPVEQGVSGFVKGLAELQARRTQTGEGLAFFLENNLGRFDEDVAGEIRSLAKEVNGYG